MCKPFQQDQGQQARPGAVIRSNLAIVDGQVLLNDNDYTTRWDATQAIRTQTSRLEGELSSAKAEIARLKAELESATGRADRYYEQLQRERQAKRTAQTIARNNKVMAGTVRDLTVLFKSVGVNVDLDFEQTDEAGYEYRVTGYNDLNMTVNFATSEASVGNKSRRRKARTSYVDMTGLSADAFVGVESLFFEVELAKSNTPRRVHDVLFEDEPKPDVPDEVRAVAMAIKDVVGADGVMVRATGGSFVRLS